MDPLIEMYKKKIADERERMKRIEKDLRNFKARREREILDSRKQIVNYEEQIQRLKYPT